MRLSDCFMEIFAYTTYLVRSPDPSQPEYKTVRKDLERLFEQSEKCGREGGFPPGDYADARFAVCAWTDEAILCSAWAGRETWVHEQLQRVYYNTANGGEEFFSRLNGMDPKRKGVREVYALCLALGFTGAYYREEQQPFLEDLKRTNFKLIAGESFSDMDIQKMELFPGAYEPGRAGEKGSFLRRVNWFNVFMLVMPPAVFAVLYILSWLWLTESVSSFFGPAS